jgi:hypothetical protein
MLLALAFAPTRAAANTTSSGSTTAKKSVHKTSRKKSRRAGKKGQQKIDSQRAQEIQQALIREHYLDGQPSGVWNDATQKAMQRYQADNGWQSKTTPDARALIKLGLGPDHQHLLNPDSAMTTQPQSAKSLPTPSSTTDPDKQQR